MRPQESMLMSETVRIDPFVEYISTFSSLYSLVLDLGYYLAIFPSNHNGDLFQNVSAMVVGLSYPA